MHQKHFAVIACKVFQDLLDKYLPKEKIDKIVYLESGLHIVPIKLHHAIQNELNLLSYPSRVLLGYGLCGNGLDDIHSGVHTLIIPKVDDCIAVLLGSHQQYLEQFNQEPATYWLSKRWLDDGSNPLVEYNQYVERFGTDQAAWLMDMQYSNYKRLALVAHSHQDLDYYQDKAQDVINFCKRWDMRFEKILGKESFFKEMVTVLFSEDGVTENFIMVQPGDTLKQSDFFR